METNPARTCRRVNKFRACRLCYKQSKKCEEILVLFAAEVRAVEDDAETIREAPRRHRAALLEQFQDNLEVLVEAIDAHKRRVGAGEEESVIIFWIVLLQQRTGEVYHPMF
ncbi:MAG: hypothetical protein M1816_005449 [Peltula sp. TS41687]|nr:MAG: hypothetical protein M1816_005449 [Peltula sp. TS41687]